MTNFSSINNITKDITINKSGSNERLSDTGSYISALRKYVDFLYECYKAGITAIQIREKAMTSQEIVVIVQMIRDKISDPSFPIFINDSIDLAKRVKTKYLHLGQTDGDIILAKRQLGLDSFIGLSIETKKELALACTEMSANYLAVSSVFKSSNKTNQKTIWGLAGLEFFCRNAQLPVVAIGGIEINNLCQVIRAGADGVAVISAIHDARNPKSTIKQIIEIINQNAKTNYSKS